MLNQHANSIVTPSSFDATSKPLIVAEIESRVPDFGYNCDKDVFVSSFKHILQISSRITLNTAVVVTRVVPPAPLPPVRPGRARLVPRHSRPLSPIPTCRRRPRPLAPHVTISAR